MELGSSRTFDRSIKLSFGGRHSEWKGGLKAQHAVGEYIIGMKNAHHEQTRSITTDEPKEILGSDAGLSPAEMTLAALGSCLMVGFRIRSVS